MSDAPHWGFVAAAYAIAAATILAMIVGVLSDFRTQSAALRRLEDVHRGGDGS
jgi:Heme exporter protein D (CcmD)